MPGAQSRSLIMDVYGAYIRELGGWLAVADLIELMAQLDVDEQAVRSTVSRMGHKGILRRRVVDNRVGYELTERGLGLLAEGDRRIYAGLPPAQLDEGWAMAVFSLPERRRDLRHKLRSRLTFLGFGNIGAGIWLAPGRALPQARAAIEELELQAYVDLFLSSYEAFGDEHELVRRCWDLDELASRYAAVVEQLESAVPQDARWSGTVAPREAFVDYTLVLHEWRKMPYLDPGLPAELLPDDWIGHHAASLFERAVDRLEKPARSYIESVVEPTIVTH